MNGGQFKKGSIPWIKGGMRGENLLRRQEKELGRKKPNHCELCGIPGDTKGIRICYEHNHITGKGRGWVCNKCNASMGLANDDIELLEKMVKYLKNNGIV